MSYPGLLYPRDEQYLRQVKERGYFILVDRNAKNISLVPGGEINNILAKNRSFLFVFGKNIAGERQDIIDALYLSGVEIEDINGIISQGISIDNINAHESQQWIDIFRRQNMTTSVVPTVTPMFSRQLELVPSIVSQLKLVPNSPLPTSTRGPRFQPTYQHTPESNTDQARHLRSQTNVVCVKVGDIRPQYNNLEEWMSNPNNVYIGRKGVVFVQNHLKKYRYPKEDSVWANPFKIKDDMTREDVINMYRNYIVDKLNRGEISREQLLQLKGKTLGCWCKEGGKDIPCHGDVLVELLNSM